MDADVLVRFQKQNDSNFALDSLDGEEKQKIFELCTQQLCFDPSVLCVACFRILTRDGQYINKLCTEELIGRLLSLAFDSSTDKELTVEAVKCLCNVAFQRNAITSQFRAFGVVSKLLDRLRSQPSIESFFISMDLKLLFIISSVDTSIRNDLKNTDALKLLSELLQNFTHHLTSEANAKLTFELLKIAYNIGYAIQRDSSSLETHLPEFKTYVLTFRELLTRLDSNDKNGCLLLQ